MLSSGKQSASFYADMWDKINTTDTWEGEILNRRKNGEIYPEYLTVTTVRDDNKVVTNYVGSLTDITLRKIAEEKIQSLAFYDPLTQLPNRRLMFDRLNQAYSSSARSGHRGALLFLDLDYFKTLNDTLGHDLGDLLLQQVATRLSDCVREGDTVARIGGDEFVVLLEGLSEHAIDAAAQTQDVAEKIMFTLNQPYQLNMHTYHSTSSLGVALFNGHEFNTEELLKQADIALYQSKAEGRNTLRFFDPKMQETIAARADLENELRKAIEHNQFQLYYQVQVGNTGQALGAEALIRWLHPERSMISPFSFIPLAEETGLILPIGQWVLDAACAQLKVWQKNPLTKDLTLAINVSAKQFKQLTFVEQVEDTIKRHEINPIRLKLELTESLLVDNVQDIITKITTLSKIGIRFSLDDFGTGYSSLQYLKQLPLNQLKIDQSFVRDIATDASDRAIVRTIITMAHSLDVNVIAEGVETAEQQQFLLDNGCTHYQGYLFGKPLPIDEFEASLRRN
jgi:diguanylate cyclase (GGDEF)-like protein